MCYASLREEIHGGSSTIVEGDLSCMLGLYLQELRLEDYTDNRKFATTTTSSLFPSAMSFTATPAATSSLFGPSMTSSTSRTSYRLTYIDKINQSIVIVEAPATTSFFGNSATTAAPTLGATLFGAQPAVSSAQTLV